MELILEGVALIGMVYWLVDYNRKAKFKFLKHNKDHGRVVL